jgi:hypothetical protein
MAEEAISERLRSSDPLPDADPIITYFDYAPDVVFLQVNSGGNGIAVSHAFKSYGWTIFPTPNPLQTPYGVSYLILRPTPPIGAIIQLHTTAGSRGNIRVENLFLDLDGRKILFERADNRANYFLILALGLAEQEGNAWLSKTKLLPEPYQVEVSATTLKEKESILGYMPGPLARIRAFYQMAMTENW